MEPPKTVDTFERQFHFVYEEVPVALYRCTKTGLRVAAAQVKSPTVHGYFTVQTEAFDDYGCPHTLEHLIFLGSERYPYKGVLDVLANRCLAQGTNAWTATDHTCYTVDTAGAEGFLRILPVYLDHVLFPTLKDSGFVTEVHHITGEGSNAGVVYCEMQARENEAGDMCDRAMRLAAYPGRCSYKSETGGRLKELRELTNKTVQEYHGAYYRPDNLCVIVTGQVDFKDLCEACRPTVAAITASDRIQKLPPLERPFSGSVPKPKDQQIVRMEFPAEDETSGGVVELCWPGPAWTDFQKVVGLKVLLAYLCEDSISPLRKALVETVPPLCGKISEGLHDYKEELINITLNSCDVEQLSKRDVTAEVQAVFAATAAEDGSGIDVARIRSVIRQQQRRHLAAVESNPHDLFSGEIIGSFCYAPDFAPGAVDNKGDSVRARLDTPAALEALLAWEATKWAALCKEFLVSASNPGVTVCGFPSKNCGEKIQSEDATRIGAQKTALGEEGCKKAGDAVAAAEEENDVDTPEEVSAEFQVPDVAKVKLIDVSTVCVKNGVVEELYGQEAAKLKALLSRTPASELPSLAFQFDHVPGTQFAKCHVMLPLAGLTTRQLDLTVAVLAMACRSTRALAAKDASSEEEMVEFADGSDTDDESPLANFVLGHVGAANVLLAVGFVIVGVTVLIFEGLHPYSAFYLVVQVITTIGYGDVTLSEPRQKLFMIFYVTLGTVLVAKVLNDLLNSAMLRAEQQVTNSLRAVVSHSSSSGSRLWWKFTSALGLVLCLLVVWVCFFALHESCSCSFGMTRIEGCDDVRCRETGGKTLDWLSAVYFGVVTFSTVGFGDYSPQSQLGRALGPFCMMAGVLSYTNLIRRMSDIIRAREEVYKEKRRCTPDVFRLIDTSGNGIIDRNEFRVYMLLRKNQVSPEALAAIDKVFDAIDLDKSGGVTFDEINGVMLG
ncbi:unnamed protein product [Symbiodinium natans]|uniref:EF-hand domain-containing protein n=1 Tax=Symbiodinium natans TaxID=878477 RepID=A0A812K9R4_9DINO|nr:unnamed protein product [Symbiodinium natans]